MKQKKISVINDFTQGNVFIQLVLFCVPFLIANLLQILYTTTDTVFIGRFAGTDSLSAVSVAGNITSVTLHVCMGFGAGAQIYTAQKIGAKTDKELPGIVGTVITFSAGAGIALAALCIIFSNQFLWAINTPESVFEETSLYFVICSAGLPLIMLGNIISGILRGMGDSRHPMYFTVVGTLINIVLDYIFIALLNWHAAGAAIATVIGQAAAFIYALIFFKRNQKKTSIKLIPDSYRIQPEHLKKWLKLSTPLVIQFTIIGFSMLYVNSAINYYGVIYSAIVGVSSKIFSIAEMIPLSINSSISTMAGQCAGSKDAKRLSEIFHWGYFLALSAVAALAVLVMVFSNNIYSFFTNDTALLELAPVFAMPTAILILTSGGMSPGLGFINGIGDTLINLIIGIADGVAGRLILSTLFGNVLGYGAFGFFLGSALTGIISIAGCMIYYYSGIWKKRLLK